MPEDQLEKIGAGGLSGKPLKQKSTELVKYILSKTRNQMPIMASGGIFTASDALEKFNAGAILVQVWTGFIYEGPAMIKKIIKAQPNFNIAAAATAAVSERSR